MTTSSYCQAPYMPFANFYLCDNQAMRDPLFKAVIDTTSQLKEVIMELKDPIVADYALKVLKQQAELRNFSDAPEGLALNRPYHSLKHKIEKYQSQATPALNCPGDKLTGAITMRQKLRIEDLVRNAFLARVNLAQSKESMNMCEQHAQLYQEYKEDIVANLGNTPSEDDLERVKSDLTVVVADLKDTVKQYKLEVVLDDEIAELTEKYTTDYKVKEIFEETVAKASKASVCTPGFKIKAVMAAFVLSGIALISRQFLQQA